MFQAAGDLGLEEEPSAALRIVGVLVLDFLQGDLSMQFGIFGNEHFTQTAFGVTPKNAEAQTC
jgi:hypothetical protein